MPSINISLWIELAFLALKMNACIKLSCLKDELLNMTNTIDQHLVMP